jgi:hypothetical protein
MKIEEPREGCPLEPHPLGGGVSMPMTTVLTALRASFGAEYFAKLYSAL